jgi:hypothetical protein
MKVLNMIDGYKQAAGLILLGVGSVLTSLSGVGIDTGNLGEELVLVGGVLAGLGAADKARKTYNDKKTPPTAQ